MIYYSVMEQACLVGELFLPAVRYPYHICHVAKICNMLSILPSDDLHWKIIFIIIFSYKPCQWFSLIHNLMDGMISNCIILLVKYWLWFQGIENHYAISFKICWPKYWDTLCSWLYWMACSVSAQTFKASNSVPNTGFSMVDSFFDIYHIYLLPALSLLQHM